MDSTDNSFGKWTITTTTDNYFDTSVRDVYYDNTVNSFTPSVDHVDKIPVMDDFSWQPTIVTKVAMGADLTIGEILACGAQEILNIARLSPYQDDIIVDQNQVSWVKQYFIND